jgi:outer membrane protein TolC
MKSASVLVSALLLFVSAPLVAQEADEPDSAKREEVAGQGLELDELLEMASENAAVLDEHEAKIQKAEWQQYRAKWAWGPKVRNDASLAPVPSNADPDSFDRNIDEFLRLDIGPYFRNKLSVVVPVFGFGRGSAIRELAALGIDTARLQRQQARRDVEYQVKRAYYSIQLSNAFSELLSEGSELVKEKLAEMEEAREFGEADFEIADLRKLQVFDAEIDSRVLDNEKLGRVASDGLRYFTGLERTRPVDVGLLDVDSTPPALGTANEYLSVARQNRPELLLLKNAVEARQAQLDLARAEYFPNVFVAGEFTYGWSTEDIVLRSVCRRPTEDAECVDTDDLFARPYNDPFDTLSVGIGLGLRWDFDFFQLRGKYGEAVAQVEEVDAQKRRAVGAIELEIRKVWADAHDAREKVDVTARRLEAARRWRDQFGLTMQSGGADMKDAVDPLKAYYEARALHLEARYNYLVSRAELAKAIGVPSLDLVAIKTEAGDE